MSESTAKKAFILLCGISITLIVSVQERIASKGDKLSANCCQISIIVNDIDSISMDLCDACIALVKKNKLFCHN